MKTKWILFWLISACVVSCKKEEEPIQGFQRILGTYIVKEIELEKRQSTPFDTLLFNQKVSYIRVVETNTGIYDIVLSYPYGPGLFENNGNHLIDSWNLDSIRPNLFRKKSMYSAIDNHGYGVTFQNDSIMAYFYYLNWNLWSSPEVSHSIVGRKINYNEYVFPDERYPN